MYSQLEMSSLPSAPYALGKGFAERDTRQGHSEKNHRQATFAERHLSGTRQRKGVVTALEPMTAALPSANLAGTRQRVFIFFFVKILCRVPTDPALGKGFKFLFLKIFLPSAT
jgi:hypothetical protein